MICTLRPTEGREMSEHRLPEWIYVPELEESIIEAETLEDFLGSNSILLNVLNNIREGISILTPDLTVVYLNEPMKYWYSQKKSFVPKKCYELFHDADKPCDNCPALQAISKGKACGSQVPFKKQMDQPGEMHIYATPIHNSEGKVVLILEYVQNISYQKQILNSYDDIMERISVLDAQNRLLLKSLAIREREYQNLRTTLKENVDNYVRPAMDYLKHHTDEKDYQMISSILEQAFYPLINDSPVKVTDTLTSREMQVANLIKKGYSSKQIADELFVTKKAVDYHRTNIRKKLGLDAKTNLQVYLEMNM